MSDGKIFISYRRVDSAHAAGRLYDSLSARFGEDQVFMDVEHLDPGVNFVEAINKAVSECDVLIALIGPGWLSAQDENNNRRLDNPLDFVRLEISAALERQIRVIPILLQGASPPKQDQLPGALQSLAQLNAFEIRHERFKADADRIMRSIVVYREEDAQHRQQDAERLEREAAQQAAREQAEREQHARELARQETHITDCMEEARAALEGEDWKTAQRNYRRILKLRPDHTEAQSGLLRASQNLELARLYGQAILYQDEGQYENALRNLRQIQFKDPQYRDVSGLVAAIEARMVERVQQEQLPADDAPPTPQSWGESRSTVPPGVGGLGGRKWIWIVGGIGLVLILALACWGGNALLDYISASRTPEPAADTPAALAATKTNTTRPDTPTPLLPTDTPTGTPTDMPTIVSPSPTPDRSKIIDDYGVPMALIPAGSFGMGSYADGGLAECKKLDSNPEECKLG